MNRKTIAAALSVLLGLGAVGATASIAAAEESSAPDLGNYCQATYETRDNPEYVPAVEESGHWETVEIEPAVEEQSHTEWRYSKHAGHGFIWVDNDDHKYVSSNGNGYAKWWDVPLWEYPFYERSQKTRTVVDVEGRDAVTEERYVIDVEAQPAQGEPTIEVQTGESCDLWVTWQAPNYVPDSPSAETVGWPQTLVGLGQLTPEACGVTYQQDRYVGAREDIEAVLADGMLTGYPPAEDEHIVQEWTFVSSEECAPQVENFRRDAKTQVCEVPTGAVEVKVYLKALTQGANLTGTYHLENLAGDYQSDVREFSLSYNTSLSDVFAFDAHHGDGLLVVNVAQVNGEDQASTWTHPYWDVASCVIPDQPEPAQGGDSSVMEFCAVPADGTRTVVTTETSWTQPYVWDAEAGAWVLGDVIEAEPVVTTESVEDAECAAPVDPTPTPEPTETETPKPGPTETETPQPEPTETDEPVKPVNDEQQPAKPAAADDDEVKAESLSETGASDWMLRAAFMAALIAALGTVTLVSSRRR